MQSVHSMKATVYSVAKETAPCMAETNTEEKVFREGEIIINSEQLALSLYGDHQVCCLLLHTAKSVVKSGLSKRCLETRTPYGVHTVMGRFDAYICSSGQIRCEHEFALVIGGPFSPYFAAFFGLHHQGVQFHWRRRRESSQVLGQCIANEFSGQWTYTSREASTKTTTTTTTTEGPFVLVAASSPRWRW